MRALVIVVGLLASCSPPSTNELPRAVPTGSGGGSAANAYDDAKMWLCRPDLGSDACHGDLSTTVIAADGSRTVEHPTYIKNGTVDCFYVYPTVDLHLTAGNHTDFSDLARIREASLAQVGRFAQVCNLYIPLYRQITIGTYRLSEADRKQYVDVAYSDVAAAFASYLAHADQTHAIVIIGHSQGARMATQLLSDNFDRDPALRARLLVAMPIGGVADTGTFKNLSPCARPDQIGCVIAYRTIANGDLPDIYEQPTASHHMLCVSPASSLQTVLIPRPGLAEDVTTPYVAIRGYYQARCMSPGDGRDFLEVSAAPLDNDKRTDLVHLDRWHGKLGLHIFDFQLPQDDLIALISAKSRARSAPH